MTKSFFTKSAVAGALSLSLATPLHADSVITALNETGLVTELGAVIGIPQVLGTAGELIPVASATLKGLLPLDQITALGPLTGPLLGTLDQLDQALTGLDTLEPLTGSLNLIQLPGL